MCGQTKLLFDWNALAHLTRRKHTDASHSCWVLLLQRMLRLRHRFRVPANPEDSAAIERNDERPVRDSDRRQSPRNRAILTEVTNRPDPSRMKETAAIFEAKFSGGIHESLCQGVFTSTGRAMDNMPSCNI